MKRAQVEEFSVQFLNIIQQRVIAGERLHMLLVLQGNITLTRENAPPQKLRENQVQVINRRVSWQLDASSDNIVIIIGVDPLTLPGSADGISQHVFRIDHQLHCRHLARISELISHIATLWLKQNGDVWRLEANRDLLEIFCILLQNFKDPAPPAPPGGPGLRIGKAVAWIKEHYRQPLSLQQLSGRLHVTTAHLSRQFTAEMGVNFRTFLTETRFHHAVKAIASTSRPIGKIVSEHGFCSARRFSRLFRQQYGIQPHAWRRGIKTGAILADDRQTLLPAETQQTRRVPPVTLFALLLRYPAPHPHALSPADTPGVEQISPSFLSPGKPLITRGYSITVGHFEELLKQHVQHQLRSLRTLLPVLQVEIADPLQDIFARRTVHTGEHNPTWSPWSNLDLAFSFLKQTDIRPLIRLEPADKSLAKLEEFIQHSAILSGEEYVRSWSFILDPGKWKSRNTAALVQTQIGLIRRLLPHSQIGIAWYQSARETQPVPAALLAIIDFIGLSLAPNHHDASSDSAEFRPQENQHVIHQQLDGLIRYLRRHAPHCRVYLQSWSTLTGNTLTINGRFFRGALLMDMLLSLPDEITLLGLWLNSELQQEIGPSHIIENNSLSLFFSATTRRPIYHIIAMKERMSGAVCDAGRGWVATHSGQTWRLLVFNAVTINPLLSVQEHLLNDYRKCFCVNLTLGEAGIWRIKRQTFDQKNGALYYQYALHPTRYDRDEETMHYISQRSEPTMRVHDERIAGRWTTRITMDINAVCLLELTRIAD